MRIEDQSQRELQQKSLDLSKDPQKEVKKSRSSLLNKLIFIICCSVISFVGLNFVVCNFMIPNSIISANILGGLKNPPPLDCKESERRGYETLLAILTTIIALKTRIDDDVS